MDRKYKKKLFWTVIISAGFLFFLLRGVEWGHFSQIAGKLDIRGLIAAYCVFLLGNAVRTLRFYKMDHMDKKVSHWWYINALYNIITSTVPGGAGEAATVYCLKRFSKYDIFGAFRILLLSRLMDLFALSAFFFIASLMMNRDTLYREAAIWLSGTIFLMSSFSLLRSIEQFVMRLIKKLSGRGAFIKKVSDMVSELIRISEEQRSKKSFGAALFLSVVMWFTGILFMHLVFRSCGIDFTFTQSTYCIGVYAIFQVVPVQGFAGIGTQAAWWSIALKAAGYDSPDTIALGFILYGIFYFFVAALGLFSMFFWLRGKGRA